jgi:hypothetical protein
MVSARHYAYSYLPGQPVVARTVWMDQRDEQSAAAIIVDWTSSSTVHTYTTSLTVPDVVGQVGPWDSDSIPDLGKAILMPGQTARLDRALITPSAPPAAPVQGTRWSASQTAKSAVFISVIGADSATLVEPIRRGRPIQILLSVIGQPDRIVTFDPPDLTPPGATTVSAVVSGERSVAGGAASAPVTAVARSVRATAFSTQSIDAADASLLESGADLLG